MVKNHQLQNKIMPTPTHTSQVDSDSKYHRSLSTQNDNETTKDTTFMNTSNPELSPVKDSQIIDAKYKIIRQIGKGGMGIVYLAQQIPLQRNVAIKLLSPNLINDQTTIERFEREAASLSKLQHPNIITIYDFGQDNKQAFIAMEYVEGETLSKYLKIHAPLNLDEFLPIAVQILKALAEAHKLGLVHRDIKPANIMLCELDGEPNFVKILDFGLAKLAQGNEDLTKEHQLVGSASFLAPEQIIHNRADARTDVYAMGIMFFFMLTGIKPFSSPNDAVLLYKHVNEPPPCLKDNLPPHSNIPPALIEVLDSCLEKNPDKRPQDAAHLLNAFSIALDAPHLKAGYSSIVLPKVELDKFESSAPKKFISTPKIPTIKDEDLHKLQNTLGPSENTSLTPSTTIKKERNYLLILIIIALIVLLILITLTIFFSSNKNKEESIVIVQDKELLSKEQNYEKIIQNAQKLNDNNDWKTALTLIEPIKDELINFPDLQTKLIILNEEINAMKTIDTIELFLKNNNIEEAFNLQNELTFIDSKNPIITKKLKDLEDKMLSFYATVSLHVTPEEAIVHLNDEPLPNHTEKLTLVPKKHKLTISANGYETKTMTINTIQFNTMEVTIKLEKIPSKNKKTHTKSQNSKQKNADLMLR